MTDLACTFWKTRMRPFQSFTVSNADQIARVHTQSILCLRRCIIITVNFSNRLWTQYAASEV